MKSKQVITAALIAVAAMGASAETFNSYLFDQMKAPATKTRAEVKAEAAQAQAQAQARPVNGLGATGQQNLVPAQADKAGSAPQASATVVNFQQQ